MQKQLEQQYRQRQWLTIMGFIPIELHQRDN